MQWIIDDERIANQEKSAQGGYPIKAYDPQRDDVLAFAQIRHTTYANARLMAKAPVLLDALEQLVAAAGAQRMRRVDVDAAVRRAREAIADAVMYPGAMTACPRV